MNEFNSKFLVGIEFYKEIDNFILFVLEGPLKNLPDKIGNRDDGKIGLSEDEAMFYFI